jgi:endo-1,4-beta-xylanase
MRSGILFSGVATCLVLAGCGNGGTADKPQTGGVQSTGGQQSSGGSGGGPAGSGGATGVGGSQGSGGLSGRGGGSGSGSGGAVGAGGASTTSSSGGRIGSGGRTSAGGQTGTAGATGTGTGGAKGTGGATSGSGGGPAVDAGGVGIDGGVTVNCAAEMPTGGNTFTGANVNGTSNGLNYGIWTNGVGGTITIFPNAHAFAASWSESQDFLAHLGLDFRNNKPYTDYGTISANFVEKKSGTAGSFSMIGMYGWMHSPCIEWYINEDSWNGLYGRGSVTAVIDGETYYLSTTTTTGTGGANACESGHTGSWTQLKSTRKTARQCGTVSVSEHFKAWEAQGWTLGSLKSVHINVEVGGGTGGIEFPVAEVTTTSQ